MLVFAQDNVSFSACREGMRVSPPSCPGYLDSGAVRLHSPAVLTGLLDALNDLENRG